MSYEPFAATPPSPEMQALYEVTSQQTELAASVAIELLAKNAPLFEGESPAIVTLAWGQASACGRSTGSLICMDYSNKTSGTSDETEWQKLLLALGCLPKERRRWLVAELKRLDPEQM